MKTTRLYLLLPLTVSLCVAGSVAMAADDEPPEDLDVTMTVMDDDQSPPGFVRQIQLPPLETPVEANVSADVISEVTTESEAIADEVAEIITGSIIDKITIEDAEDLRDLLGDIVDNLNDDTTIIDEVLGEGSLNTDTGSIVDNAIGAGISDTTGDMTTDFGSDWTMTDVTDSTDQVIEETTDVIESTEDTTDEITEQTENTVPEELDRLRSLP